MPLYEYECTACHKRTEKIQKFSDPEITVCPHCGGHIERVLSAPAIAFKGGGWYADGYGNAKPKSSGDSSSAGKSAGEGSSSGDNKSSSEAKSGGESKPSGDTKPSTDNASASKPAPAPPAATPASAASSSK